MTECHEEHKKISDELHEINQKLEYHIVEVHAALKKDVKIGDDQLHTNQEAILDTLLGPRLGYGIHKNERNTQQGMEHKVTDLAHKVDTLWKQSQNGGLRAQLSKSDNTKLWAAVLASLVTLILDLLNSTP